MNKKLKFNSGSSLVEAVFYIFLLVLILTVVINALYSLGRSYKNMTSGAAIEMTAETALERMTREIKDSTSVDISASTLDSSIGKLVLNTTDENSLATTIEFYLDNGAIKVKEAGIEQGSLSPQKARVTNLMFKKITAAESEAVKIEMTVESGDGSTYKSKKFYSTSVLRGSYPLQ